MGFVGQDGIKRNSEEKVKRTFQQAILRGRVRLESPERVKDNNLGLLGLSRQSHARNMEIYSKRNENRERLVPHLQERKGSFTALHARFGTLFFGLFSLWVVCMHAGE